MTQHARALTFRGLRIVWQVLLVAVFLFVWIAEKFHSNDKQIAHRGYAVICIVSIWLMVSIFRLRKRSAKRLAGLDGIVDFKNLRRAYAIQLMLMACSFAAVEYGVLVRFMGATLNQTVPFYLIGFLLLVYFKPKEVSIKGNEPRS